MLKMCDTGSKSLYNLKESLSSYPSVRLKKMLGLISFLIPFPEVAQGTSFC